MAPSIFKRVGHLTPLQKVAFIFAVYCIWFVALEPLRIRFAGISQPSFAYACYKVITQSFFFTLLFHWRTVKQLFRKKQAGASPPL